MNVKIVQFPETKVAALEYRGSPEMENISAREFVEWRLANKLIGERHRSYGIHYTNPRTTPPDQHRVDFCVSVFEDVPPNSLGVTNKIIPAGRCAVARHHGSRENVEAARHLFEEWLPKSGEELRDFPVFFHYVNVGPNIKPEDMITDVYLPIK